MKKYHDTEIACDLYKELSMSNLDIFYKILYVDCFSPKSQA